MVANPLTVSSLVFLGAEPFEIATVKIIVPATSSVDFMLHKNVEPCVGTGSVAPINSDVGTPVIEEGKTVVLVVAIVVVGKLLNSSLTKAVSTIKLVLNPLIVTSLVLVGAEPLEIVRVRIIVPATSLADFLFHENIELCAGVGSVAPINSDVGTPVIEEGKTVVLVVERVVV